MAKWEWFLIGVGAALLIAVGAFIFFGERNYRRTQRIRNEPVVPPVESEES